jgi:CBS-domain-containing membrane protein
VVTVTYVVPLREAAALMAEHGFTAFPVIDGGRQVGVNDRDRPLRGRYGAVPEASEHRCPRC